MFKKLIFALPALFLVAPTLSMAFGSASPEALTDLHFVVGSGANVPSPSTCVTITDMRLDVTIHGSSVNFGVNGNGTCTGTAVPLVLTGSGVLVPGTNGEPTSAIFDVYFGDTRMNCVVTLSPFSGGCHLYMLADLSLAANFDIALSILP